MKILVTGGSGFIGSHLVEKLLREHDVIVLDKAKQSTSRARYIRGDVRNKDDVENAIAGCKVVFHLAALTDVRGGENDYETNAAGARNVFEAAARQGAKVIFTSSAAVYGSAALCRENAECSPLSEYGKSKLAAERFLKESGANYFILRMFNVYGPGGKSVINTFCSAISSGQGITVFGDGRQTRDYVYVDDVVNALLLGIDRSGTYNAGTGTPTPLNEIIEKIKNLTRKPAKVRYAPADGREIMASTADITKISSLGWKPKISVEKGIARILSGY